MLVQIIPYILGASISPVVLAVCVLMLAEKQKPLQKAFVFFLGTLTAAIPIGSAIFFAVHTRSQATRPSLTDSTIHIIVGAVLLVMAVRIWRKPHKKTKVSKKVHYSRNFILGMVLVASDVTSLIMFVPAGLELQTASADVRLAGLVLLIMALTMAAWLPLVAVILLGETGKRLLGVANTFMTKHGQQVSGGMIGAIALYVLFKGLSGL